MNEHDLKSRGQLETRLLNGKREVRLLGSVDMTGSALSRLPVKAKAMLCLLTRANGNKMSRDRIADILWSNSDQTRAQASLRQTLRQLRTVLGPDALQSIAGDIHFDVDSFDVDVVHLERAWRSGRIEDAKIASRLIVGDFAADIVVDGEPMQDWLVSERATIREQAAEVCLRVAANTLDRGEPEDAKRTAERFLDIDPYFEPMHRVLMRAFVALGRRSSAIEHYRLFRDALAEELNTDPDPKTEALLQEVLGKTYAATAGHASVVDPEDPDEAGPAPPTIAVLPIEELGDIAGTSFIALGLAEELIVSLSGWRTFPVVAPASSLVALDRTLDTSSIGKLLNADYLVVSRLHYAGGSARLTSRLIQLRTDHTIWAGSFDLSLANPLAAQEELSTIIASLVHQNAIQSEMKRIVWKRTSDLAAWELVILGQQELQKLTAVGNKSARDYFKAALEIDPECTDAHVGVATSFCWDVQHVKKHDWPSLLELAEEAAQRALQSDWNFPLAHTRLGAVYTWREDFARGLAETELALHLNPSEAGTRLALGNRLDLVGQSEAGIAHLEKGLQLNPLEPRSALYFGYLARALLATGHPERARDYALRGVTLRPNDAEMHLRLAACAANLGDQQGALRALQACEKIEKGFVARKRDWQPYQDKSRNEAVLEGLKRFALM